MGCCEHELVEIDIIMFIVVMRAFFLTAVVMDDLSLLFLSHDDDVHISWFDGFLPLNLWSYFGYLLDNTLKSMIPYMITCQMRTRAALHAENREDHASGLFMNSTRCCC